MKTARAAAGTTIHAGPQRCSPNTSGMDGRTLRHGDSAAETGRLAMSSDLETKKSRLAGDEPNPATTSKVGIRITEHTDREANIVLSRYREASIAVVAIALVVDFQIGSGGEFLSAQFLGVVFRDTGRIGLSRSPKSC